MHSCRSRSSANIFCDCRSQFHTYLLPVIRKCCFAAIRISRISEWRTNNYKIYNNASNIEDVAVVRNMLNVAVDRKNNSSGNKEGTICELMRMQSCSYAAHPHPAFPVKRQQSARCNPTLLGWTHNIHLPTCSFPAITSTFDHASGSARHKR